MISDLQRRMNRRTAWMLAMAMAFASEGIAQQFVYPAKGQSPQQQKSDEAACYSWAVQQTGFDLAKPPPQDSRRTSSRRPPNSSKRPSGRRARHSWRAAATR